MYLDRFNETFTFLFTLEAVLKLYVFRLVSSKNIKLVTAVEVSHVNRGYVYSYTYIHGLPDEVLFKSNSN